jgi:hypothetical protein
MSSRFLAFALVALMLVLGASSVALTSSVYAQGDDLWYPGEGVKQDMYVKYRIEELDTADGEPFIMTLWFKEQQDGEWTVPAAVEHGNNVITGTMKLADNMGYLAGGSQVPDEMNDFIGGYLGSLHWVDSFTTKEDPKSLNSGNWGRTGTIGGSDLKPSGKEKITVAGEEYETTVLILHKGVDSKIWVLNEFPFPIKAEFFTDTTTGNPEIQFKFELLEQGTGEPPALSGSGEPQKPPIEKRTHSGYTIKLAWTPEEIRPGNDVSLGLEMYDPQEFPLLDVRYDLTVKDSKGQLVKEFKNQAAEVGTATHQVNFNGTGTMMVTVKLTAISGQTTGQFVESADFGIVVVPEFPVSAAIIVAAVIGLAVIMTRARGTSLGGLFGSKGYP